MLSRGHKSISCYQTAGCNKRVLANLAVLIGRCSLDHSDSEEIEISSYVAISFDKENGK